MGRAKGGGFAVFESVAEFFQRREAKVQREPGTPPDTVPAEPLHLASDDADAVRVEAHPRILRGWARHVGGRLVVEVTLDADFEWAGASNVTLRFRETTVEAEVEAAATTRAGTLTLGQVLRLVVRIPDGMSQIVDLVDLVDANGAWRIELEVPPSEARG